MVAPTWLLISSPIIGSPCSMKRFCQYAWEAMNTGTQFTNAHPASRICSTYHLVAISEPTGRQLTTTSVLVSFKICTISAVGPEAFLTLMFRYLPRPSCVIPRSTLMPSLGASENLIVLLG